MTAAKVVFALMVFYYAGESGEHAGDLAEHVWLAPDHMRGSYADCMANAAETLRHNQLDLIEILCVPMPGVKL